MKESTKEKMSLSPVELADELSMINKEYLIVEGQSDKCFWEHLHQEGLKKRQIRVANKKQCSGNKEYNVFSGEKFDDIMFNNVIEHFIQKKIEQ